VGGLFQEFLLSQTIVWQISPWPGDPKEAAVGSVAGKAGYDCKHPDEQDDGHAKQVQGHEMRRVEERITAK
jgi:hypothetical protein